jgi:hypothetical protein
MGKTNAYLILIRKPHGRRLFGKSRRRRRVALLGIFREVKDRKVKLSLCLIEHHAMKTWEWRYSLIILDLDTRWKEVDCEYRR